MFTYLPEHNPMYDFYTKNLSYFIFKYKMSTYRFNLFIFIFVLSILTTLSRDREIMYTNKCTKCGREFETKNPKRMICPDCLYPERTTIDPNTPQAEFQRSYSAGVGAPAGNSYSRKPYDPSRKSSYGNSYGSRGGFNKPQRQGGFKKPAQRRPQKPKAPLVDKLTLEKIEEMYKKMLPLPNPDAHEVIAQALDLEPKKAFFAINLVRQKLMLPKVQYPKRKLALTPDQLMAIKNLYEPLLPTPPIGCHKIISVQLRLDEWRVHVGIGLVRKQMGLERWNPDRPDAPEEFKNKQKEQ